MNNVPQKVWKRK